MKNKHILIFFIIYGLIFQIFCRGLKVWPISEKFDIIGDIKNSTSSNQSNIYAYPLLNVLILIFNF